MQAFIIGIIFNSKHVYVYQLLIESET